MPRKVVSHRNIGGRTFGDVITSRRKALHMNQTDLAVRIGISRNTVAGWETNHSRPDINMLPRLCDALEFTIDEFFGEAHSFTQKERKMLDLFACLSPEDQEVMTWQLEAVVHQRELQRRPSAADNLIPLYFSELYAAAGISAILDEDKGETVYVPRNGLTEKADMIITVSGDSMEPTYRNGDCVLVERAKTLRPGEIGIFLVDNEGYIKEYRADGLHSHNPAYKTMRFNGNTVVRIVGRVIGLLKD